MHRRRGRHGHRGGHPGHRPGPQARRHRAFERLRRFVHRHRGHDRPRNALHRGRRRREVRRRLQPRRPLRREERHQHLPELPPLDPPAQAVRELLRPDVRDHRLAGGPRHPVRGQHLHRRGPEGVARLRQGRQRQPRRLLHAVLRRRGREAGRAGVLQHVRPQARRGRRQGERRAG